MENNKFINNKTITKLIRTIQKDNLIPMHVQMCVFVYSKPTSYTKTKKILLIIQFLEHK